MCAESFTLKPQAARLPWHGAERARLLERLVVGQPALQLRRAAALQERQAEVVLRDVGRIEAQLAAGGVHRRRRLGRQLRVLHHAVAAAARGEDAHRLSWPHLGQHHGARLRAGRHARAHQQRVAHPRQGVVHAVNVHVLHAAGGHVRQRAGAGQRRVHAAVAVRRRGQRAACLQQQLAPLRREARQPALVEEEQLVRSQAKVACMRTDTGRVTCGEPTSPGRRVSGPALGGWGRSAAPWDWKKATVLPRVASDVITYQGTAAEPGGTPADCSARRCRQRRRSACSWKSDLPDGRPMLYMPLGSADPSRVPCPPASSSSATRPAASAPSAAALQAAFSSLVAVLTRACACARRAAPWAGARGQGWRGAGRRCAPMRAPRLRLPRPCLPSSGPCRSALVRAVGQPRSCGMIIHAAPAPDSQGQYPSRPAARAGAASHRRCTGPKTGTHAPAAKATGISATRTGS